MELWDCCHLLFFFMLLLTLLFVSLILTCLYQYAFPWSQLNRRKSWLWLAYVIRAKLRKLLRRERAMILSAMSIIEKTYAWRWEKTSSNQYWLRKSSPIENALQWLQIYSNHIYVNFGWRDGYESDPRSYDYYLTSSENKTWKKFRPERYLHSSPLRYRCSVLQTELVIMLVLNKPSKWWVNDCKYMKII